MKVKKDILYTNNKSNVYTIKMGTWKNKILKTRIYTSQIKFDFK
jgi:hypothetical protein